ncbi:MAG TPA: hypothetical protein VLV18_05435 [Terriglobales bacterium]|nr:hypothetical protein [Terriglobales bacterium]
MAKGLNDLAARPSATNLTCHFQRLLSYLLDSVGTWSSKPLKSGGAKQCVKQLRRAAMNQPPIEEHAASHPELKAAIEK